MPYTDLEIGLRETLTRATSFSCDNVTRNDRRVLGRGANQAVVLSYGGGPATDEFSFGTVRHTWIINVDLFVRWPGEQSSMANNWIADRQELIDIVEQWPRLNNTTGVLGAFITVGEPAEPQTEGRTAYMVQRLLCQIEEVVEPVRQE